MIYTAPAAFNPMWEDALLAGVRLRRCLAWLIDLVLVGMLVVTVFFSLLLMGLVTFPAWAGGSSASFRWCRSPMLTVCS